MTYKLFSTYTLHLHTNISSPYPYRRSPYHLFSPLQPDLSLNTRPYLHPSNQHLLLHKHISRIIFLHSRMDQLADSISLDWPEIANLEKSERTTRHNQKDEQNSPTMNPHYTNPTYPPTAPNLDKKTTRNNIQSKVSNTHNSYTHTSLPYRTLVQYTSHSILS